jgi:hypothetical protein
MRGFGEMQLESIVDNANDAVQEVDSKQPEEDDKADDLDNLDSSEQEGQSPRPRQSQARQALRPACGEPAGVVDADVVSSDGQSFRPRQAGEEEEKEEHESAGGNEHPQSRCSSLALCGCCRSCMSSLSKIQLGQILPKVLFLS